MLKGVKLIVSDKCLGLVEALGEFYPESAWQPCVVHFYHNVLTAVPRSRAKEVATMLKAIHAQEDRPAASQKAQAVVEKLEAMKLTKAASIVREGAGETLAHFGLLAPAQPREYQSNDYSGTNVRKKAGHYHQTIEDQPRRWRKTAPETKVQ